MPCQTKYCTGIQWSGIEPSRAGRAISVRSSDGFELVDFGHEWLAIELVVHCVSWA